MWQNFSAATRGRSGPKQCRRDAWSGTAPKLMLDTSKKVLIVLGTQSTSLYNRRDTCLSPEERPPRAVFPSGG
eukprot:9491584-Pyramimonas_sp.AAC.1